MEGKDEEIVVLVSPICSSSLEAAKMMEEWARGKGKKVIEISVLEAEGQEYVLRFGVRRVPALIIGGRLISEGRIEPPEGS